MARGRRVERYPVELAYRLDTSTLYGLGLLRPDSITTGTLRWLSVWSEDEAAVTVSLVSPVQVTVSMDGLRQVIPLRCTAQPLGGWRWWLTCPVTRQRCRALYLPNGGSRFASRQAYRLIYRSQQLSREGRASHRMQRLADELDVNEDGDPTRPKGMWRRTFDRKAAQLAEVQAEVDSAIIDFLARQPWAREALEGLL